MPAIIVIDVAGERHALDAALDEPLMHALRDGGFVDAVCGGAMSCGTCAVALEPITPLPGAGPLEQSLLDGLGCTAEGARLSCQLCVTPEVDGLTVRVLALE